MFFSNVDLFPFVALSDPFQNRSFGAKIHFKGPGKKTLTVSLPILKDLKSLIVRLLVWQSAELLCLHLLFVSSISTLSNLSWQDLFFFALFLFVLSARQIGSVVGPWSLVQTWSTECKWDPSFVIFFQLPCFFFFNFTVFRQVKTLLWNPSAFSRNNKKRHYSYEMFTNL